MIRSIHGGNSRQREFGNLGKNATSPSASENRGYEVVRFIKAKAVAAVGGKGHFSPILLPSSCLISYRIEDLNTGASKIAGFGKGTAVQPIWGPRQDSGPRLHLEIARCG
jgi:hypothetical protein